MSAVDFDLYLAQPFDHLVERWSLLTIARDSLCRLMGQHPGASP